MIPAAKHARLGPSNHRWPHCPGSVREEAAYPDVPGAAAIDGTGSHLLLEMCLENDVRAEVYDGQTIGIGHEDSPMGWFVDRGRIERVQSCLDYLSRRVAELRTEYPEGTITVESESRSDPGVRHGRNDYWGTVDITITVFSNVDGVDNFIEIVDYKDGRMWVDAKSNDQLLGYSIGKVREYSDTRRFGCRNTIVQPRTSPVVRYESVLPEELAEHEARLIEAASKTDDPNAPLIPDDKGGKGYCRWCKHRDNCEPLKEAQTQQLKDGVNMNELSEPLFSELVQSIDKIGSLSGDSLGKLADSKEQVLELYKRIDTELELRLTRGDTIAGWEMKPGKASKLWVKSEEETVKALKAKRFTVKEIYPPKLLSPAKALGKSGLTQTQKKRLEDDLVVTKAGPLRPTKVPIHTKKLSPQMMFSGTSANERPSFL